MFTTDLYVDRPIPDSHLAKAFARVTGISPSHVAVLRRNDLDRLGTIWAEGWPQIVLRTSHIRGDFPFAIELIARSAHVEEGLRQTLASVVQHLGVSILTDEFQGDSVVVSEFLLFAPDGVQVPVAIDDEGFTAEEPTLALLPDSRRVYEAHRQVSGPMAFTA
jgi:hypothetical protein